MKKVNVGKLHTDEQWAELMKWLHAHKLEIRITKHGVFFEPSPRRWQQFKHIEEEGM